MHVLARPVRANGKTWPTGTSIDQLPSECRESVRGSGWTRPATSEPATSAHPEVPTSDDFEPTTTEVDPGVPDDPGTETPNAESNIDIASDANDEPTNNSPSLDTLEISDDLMQLLKGARLQDDTGLATVADVIAFGEQNKGWRVIKGVGKVSNEEIQAAIDKAE